MSPENIFDKILKCQKDSKGVSIYPNGIWKPFNGSPNFEYCNWLHYNLNRAFHDNTLDLKIKNLYFYFIHHDGINACADNTNPPYNFIGVTKGLVDYVTFLFCNIVRHENFLPDIFEINLAEESIIIYNETFFSWQKFCTDNSLKKYEPEGYFPSNSKRLIISKGLILNFIFFIIMHEIGHLNQKSRSLFFEFDNLPNEEKDNLSNQTLEMYADKYAVNQLAEQLINSYKNLSKEGNTQVFFENKRNLVRYAIFILFVMFYLFSVETKFEKYILKYPHPHPSMRFNYSVTLLLDLFVNNSFLNNAEREELGKQSIKDFASIMQKYFQIPK